MSGFASNLPELLEWIPEAQRPQPIKMLKHLQEPPRPLPLE
jgi:hypothetical protein